MKLWQGYLLWLNFDWCSRQPNRDHRVSQTSAVVTLVIFTCCLALPTALVVSLALSPPKKLQAKAQMKGLEIALKGYETEYYSPLPGVYGYQEDVLKPFEGEILETLMGLKNQHNERGIQFYDPPAAHFKRSGIFRDAAGRWQLRDFRGQPFYLLFDADNDGRIPHPFMPGEFVHGSKYLIISGGRDRDIYKTKDNLYSWY